MNLFQTCRLMNKLDTLDLTQFEGYNVSTVEGKRMQLKQALWVGMLAGYEQCEKENSIETEKSLRGFTEKDWSWSARYDQVSKPR